VTITNIRHAGIVVADMERSLHFYRDLLGLEVWADFRDDSEYVRAVTETSGADIWMIKLKAADGGAIELLQYLSHPQNVPEPAHAYDLGCNHVALQVDDLDTLYEKLKAESIRFHTPPIVSPDGGAKVTYCRDPEGVIIELVELVDSAA